MAAEGIFSYSVASVVEDVLKQHGARLSDIDLASRKAEEASLRRYEAAGWLRKIVGVVCSKDLPAEPSEEDFRLGLRGGIILCNALNKVQPGAVPKVVEAPNDTSPIPDGAALMAYQYFENLRNFLVVVEEMGLPTFEASDLEKGGKTARVVNCVLALKSFHDWKVGGCNGSWKFGGSVKAPSMAKAFMRKNSEPFTSSISRTSSVSDKSFETLSSEQCGDLGLDFNDMSNSHSLNMLVRAVLSDKKHEEIAYIVESMLSKVMEEFERRLASQSELIKATSASTDVSGLNISPPEPTTEEAQVNLLTTSSSDQITEKDDKNGTKIIERDSSEQYINEKASEVLPKKHVSLIERQHKDIQELKHTVHSTKASMQFLQMKYAEEFNSLGKQLQSLAYAASGYQKVLEENRKLYNQVQDLKGNIRVYCRVRPFLPGQISHSSTVDHLDEGNITIIAPSKYSKEGKKSFTFNRVFGPSATQAEVFADTQPLIRSVLDGYNVCIFAYGQTGSGKTFTMTGPNELTEESFGVNYRALNDLFHLAEQRKATFNYEVSVQMMEIYNEQVRDLLVTDGSNKRLEIRNSSQNGINVPDANRSPVSSTSDVINLMNLGHKNRAVCSTAMNDRSSRSHSCLTVHVQGKDLTSGATLRGCMHLVDLAGSERVDKSEVTGDRLKEAQHINKSLSALGDVIASLAQKNIHVPYRNSKLTQLLQDALGGQAKTLMFVHISPELEAVGETLSTLKFAERVSTVELGAARVNKEVSDVKDLKEQIASLKTALARKEEETELLARSISSSPENQSIKSTASSPSHPSWRGAGEVSSGRKTPTEDGSNVKTKNKTKTKTKTKPRRRSLDPQDLLSSSSPWPRMQKGEEKNSGSGDWIDKIATKQDIQSSLENSEEESRKSPEAYSIDSNVMSRNEPATTDDLDEFEIATSDSSELDFVIHLPRVSSLPNGLGLKPRKVQTKPTRSPETRSLIPTPPSRRQPNGTTTTSLAPKTGRQSLQAKRKPGNPK